MRRARGGSRAFSKRSNPPRAPPSLFPCGSGCRKLSRLGALVRAPSEPSPAAPVRFFCLLTSRALRALQKATQTRLRLARQGKRMLPRALFSQTTSAPSSLLSLRSGTAVARLLAAWNCTATLSRSRQPINALMFLTHCRALRALRKPTRRAFRCGQLGNRSAALPLLHKLSSTAGTSLVSRHGTAVARVLRTRAVFLFGCRIQSPTNKARPKGQPLRQGCAPPPCACAAVGYRGARVLGARFVTPAGV